MHALVFLFDVRAVQAVLDHEAIANLTSSKPVGLKGNKSRGETPQGSMSRPEKKSISALDDLLKKVFISLNFEMCFLIFSFTGIFNNFLVAAFLLPLSS